MRPNSLTIPSIRYGKVEGVKEGGGPLLRSHNRWGFGRKRGDGVKEEVGNGLFVENS